VSWKVLEKKDFVENAGIWSLQVLESPEKSILMSVRTLQSKTEQFGSAKKSEETLWDSLRSLLQSVPGKTRLPNVSHTPIKSENDHLCVS